LINEEWRSDKRGDLTAGRGGYYIQALETELRQVGPSGIKTSVSGRSIPGSMSMNR